MLMCGKRALLLVGLLDGLTKFEVTLVSRELIEVFEKAHRNVHKAYIPQQRAFPLLSAKLGAIPRLVGFEKRHVARIAPIIAPQIPCSFHGSPDKNLLVECCFANTSHFCACRTIVLPNIQLNN